ncbi:phosphotransferase [Microlunatus soli]|uniref:phosphotransferase n=1 Tax=Microlunatus soli TaxID=630515 RepID=UPI0012F8FF39|nr:phosphotransferase [Microlunatus soli]
MPVHPLTDDGRDLIIAALSRIAGRPIAVIDQQHVGHDHAPVTRLRLDQDLAGVGDSVMIKTRRTDGAGHGGPPFLRREAAGLLTAADSGVTPRLLHFDDRAGLAIQTDVGTWPTLQELLLGSDPDAAAAGMIATGEALGRLHATTIDREDEHRRTLQGFAADTDSDAGYVHTGEHWQQLEAACRDLDLPAAEPARAEALALFARAADPQPGTLIHVDPNPTNVLITADGARLVDFEGCRFGHPGIDAAFLIYPFPHHSHPWGLLPGPLVDEVEDSYRRTLAAAGTDRMLADDTGMLTDGAAITLIGRVRRLRLIAASGQQPLESWRRRGQVVQQVATFARLAERSRTLPELTEWLTRLAAAMVRRWPDATDPPAPLYPAFDSR